METKINYFRLMIKEKGGRWIDTKQNMPCRQGEEENDEKTTRKFCGSWKIMYFPISFENRLKDITNFEAVKAYEEQGHGLIKED